jgi:hypothetical protein
LQHPYHSNCSLNICWMAAWVNEGTKQTRQPKRMALIRTGKRSIGTKPRLKMATETHDNAIWYPRSSLVPPSWAFVTCG